jgi:hypothetical protein
MFLRIMAWEVFERYRLAVRSPICSKVIYERANTRPTRTKFVCTSTIRSDFLFAELEKAVQETPMCCRRCGGARWALGSRIGIPERSPQKAQLRLKKQKQSVRIERNKIISCHIGQSQHRIKLLEVPQVRELSTCFHAWHHAFPGPHSWSEPAWARDN